MNENLPVPPAELPAWFRDGSPVTVTRGTLSRGGYCYQPAGTQGLYPAVLIVFDDLAPRGGLGRMGRLLRPDH